MGTGRSAPSPLENRVFLFDRFFLDSAFCGHRHQPFLALCAMGRKGICNFFNDSGSMLPFLYHPLFLFFFLPRYACFRSTLSLLLYLPWGRFGKSSPPPPFCCVSLIFPNSKNHVDGKRCSSSPSLFPNLTLRPGRTPIPQPRCPSTNQPPHSPFRSEIFSALHLPSSSVLPADILLTGPPSLPFHRNRARFLHLSLEPSSLRS